MLQIRPMRWFSWDFTVERDGRAVAELDISWWRERGALTIAGHTYGIAREGLIAGDFRLTGPDNAVVATASKPSLLRRRFDVIYRGDRFPKWKGNLFATGLAGQQLARLEIAGGTVTHQETLLRGFGRIRAVRTGPDGSLYVVFDTPGRIVRLVPAP